MASHLTVKLSPSSKMDTIQIFQNLRATASSYPRYLIKTEMPGFCSPAALHEVLIMATLLPRCTTGDELQVHTSKCPVPQDHSCKDRQLCTPWHTPEPGTFLPTHRRAQAGPSFPCVHTNSLCTMMWRSDGLQKTHKIKATVCSLL